MEKQLLSGNEAIARGAFEAGVKVGTGYPGTPSTEILENLTKYPDLYTEWSVNEKVALETGFGAALAGARTLVTMKHVGVNVAADPLFTASYIGVKGGLVLAVADDPDMHSSQNEQDSRHYARAAKLPMLEPSDSQEAKEFVKEALDLSEQFDTPVFLRSTTRISHSRGQVSVAETVHRSTVEPGFSRNPKKLVMIPAFARPAHLKVEERQKQLADWAETAPINRAEYNDNKLGIITSGICYAYIKEALPEASVLKLGMVYPLPMKKIQEFVKRCDRVVVVEELDPFIEDQLKAVGIRVEGKNLFPVTGEFHPAMIKSILRPDAERKTQIATALQLPPRPPALCPGCPHQQVFNVLRDKGITVTGDIGCYTLGVLPPYSAMDTCVDMGASVTVAQGIEIAEQQLGVAQPKRIAAVIGDSTFAHSGLTGLVNAAYNNRHSLIIVLDNSTTAMTGMQPNPFNGERIDGSQAVQVDYAALAKAVGIAEENYREISAYKLEPIDETIEELLQSNKLSLLVVKGTCVIYKRRLAKRMKEQQN